MKNYRVALFDLDGTLLDTLDDLTDSVNFALANYGYPLRTKVEVCSFVGNGVKKLVERALPADAKNFDEVFNDFREHYAVHCNDKTHVYDGILPTLQELKRRGVKIGVVSNKSDSAVQELKKIYFSSLADVAIGENESAGVRKKPAPDCVFKAMELLGAKQEECVYIGDSDVDLLTANNSSLPCISVLWGFRKREFLLSHGATTFVSAPEELLDYFSRGE